MFSVNTKVYPLKYSPQIDAQLSSTPRPTTTTTLHRPTPPGRRHTYYIVESTTTKQSMFYQLIYPFLPYLYFPIVTKTTNKTNQITLIETENLTLRTNLNTLNENPDTTVATQSTQITDLTAKLNIAIDTFNNERTLHQNPIQSFYTNFSDTVTQKDADYATCVTTATDIESILARKKSISHNPHSEISATSIHQELLTNDVEEHKRKFEILNSR